VSTVCYDASALLLAQQVEWHEADACGGCHAMLHRYWQCEPDYVCISQARAQQTPVARAATTTKQPPPGPPPAKQVVVRSPPPQAAKPPPPYFEQPPHDTQASELMIIAPWGLCGGLGQCQSNKTCAGYECANGYSCNYYDELAWQCQPAVTPFWAEAVSPTAGGASNCAVSEPM
jgi:hypothetical protein